MSSIETEVGIVKNMIQNIYAISVAMKRTNKEK
jgi:hypothetical protein